MSGQEEHGGDKIDPAGALFERGRTFRQWQPLDVEDSLLRQAYTAASYGPTSLNCQPARIVFAHSRSAKADLLEMVDAGNRSKTATAPITAIVGYDLEFHRQLERVLPGKNAQARFLADDAYTLETAKLNCALQAGYLFLALRRIGLDIGPMSGFNNRAIDQRFFAGGSIKSYLLCNIGYGDVSGLLPRNPRLLFEDACEVV